MKKLLIIIIAAFLIFSFCSCKKNDKIINSEMNNTVSLTENTENSDITDLYTVTKNDRAWYSYSFSDLDGNILFEKENVLREPKINQIAENVYELITQTGTGLSTNWAVYCDVKNSKTSSLYYYVLASKDNYVVCGDYENGEPFIIVQNIFENDEKGYYKKYKLENVSSVATDFTTDCKFDEHGNIIVTYLTGDDFIEKDYIIYIP